MSGSSNVASGAYISKSLAVARDPYLHHYHRLYFFLFPSSFRAEHGQQMYVVVKGLEGVQLTC